MPCRVKDDTYVHVRGERLYLYRAVDKFRSRGLKANPLSGNRLPLYQGADPTPLAVCQQTAARQRMLGFKSFVSASVTLEGIEVANMIRKGQLTPGLCPFKQFAILAA